MGTKQEWLFSKLYEAINTFRVIYDLIFRSTYIMIMYLFSARVKDSIAPYKIRISFWMASNFQLYISGSCVD